MALTRAVLAEMVRQAERSLDRQIETIRDEENKSERMTTVGVASMGGGVALTVFAVSSVPFLVDRQFLFVSLVGAALNLLALVALVHSYVRISVRVGARELGPAVEWIQGQSMLDDWNLEDLRLSVLKAMKSFASSNARMARATVQARNVGIYLLLGAVGTYGAALSYILGRSI